MNEDESTMNLAVEMLCDRSSLKFVDCVVLAGGVCFVRVLVLDAHGACRMLQTCDRRVTGSPRLNENVFSRSVT
jgi:hypothetical protein